MALQLIKRRARYIDINTRFQIDGRPELVQDLEAIYNSLFNLLNCPIGSRFWNPDYGCSLWSYLQEPLVLGRVIELQEALVLQIQRWEPRILLDYANTWVAARPQMDGVNINIEGTDRITGQTFAAMYTALRSSGMESDITV